MILKRLQATNYLQHKKLDQDLSGTMIAIIGPNGSGKSNLLGMIQFILTGEQPGYVKSDLISWGESSGSVQLDFEHNGATCMIFRRLDKAEAAFTFGDEKTVHGITAVAEKIKEKLELDKDLAKQGVFVLQAELDAILFTDPRVRELSFQKLMGIGDVAKVYDALGKELTKMTKPQDYSAQIADGRDKLADTANRMKTAQTAIDALQAKIASYGAPAVIGIEIDKHSNLLRAIEAANMALRLGGGGETPVAGLKATLDAAQERLGAVCGVSPATKADVDGLARNYASVRAALVALPPLALSVAQLAERVNVAEGQYAAAVASPCPKIEEIDAAYKLATEANGELNRLLGQIGLRDSLLKALRSAQANNLGECPVCGSPVTDKAALEDKLTVKVDTMMREAFTLRDAATSQDEQARELRQTAEAFERKRHACRVELDAATAQYNSALAVLNERCTAVTGADSSKYDAETVARNIELVDKNATELQDAFNARERAQVAYDSAANAEATARRTMTDAITTLMTVSGHPEETVSDSTWRDAMTASALEKIAVLRKASEVSNQLHIELAGLNGMLGELQKAHTAFERTVTTLQASQDSNKGVAAAIDTLTRVRDWFHYANGPHALASSVLESLTGDVNKYLSLFSAPFTVTPSDDSLGFKYTYTDGRPTPDGGADAGKLSGGQKAQLAVSFRFATYGMFASKLGLLSLDEPTAYLDDANVGRFGELLERVKEVAKTMNVQVVMATHERSVMPFMDTTIDLGAK